MGENYTADEAKKRNIEKMGEALGTQYSELWQEVTLLHINWKEYVELFGTNEQRIELLNKAAPSFFRRLQDELLEATLLHIARLTDPPVSLGKRENLTLQNLPGLIMDGNVKKEVQTAVDRAGAEAAFARDWRNRRIAHRDLSLAIDDQPAKPLESGSRGQINKIVKAMADVMNAVSLPFLESQTVFDFGGQLGGAMNLLYVLHSGVKVREERAKRVAMGEFSLEDDLDPPL